MLHQVLGQPLTHRFGVFFFVAGSVLNPIDIRFQEVSGLQAAITTRTDESAAAQMYRKVIPTGVDYSNLVLKRGVVINSALTQQVQLALHDFKLLRSNVLVTIYSELGVPTAAFLFAEAYPIAWEINSLNASKEEILIESLTLTYTRMRSVTL
ncbi:MAG: phage tail protein [Cyanobacteriota bacterium]